MSVFLGPEELDGMEGWRKSSFSGAAGHCVEVAAVDGGIAVRNSTSPESGALKFSDAEWAAFVAGCKADEFGFIE